MTSAAADLRLCRCGHYAFMHLGGNADCMHCNSAIRQPQACKTGTCCHAFREVADDAD